MKTNLYLLLITLCAFGCQAQHSVTTNEIISTTDHRLFGVQSASGKLLIDTIYPEIRKVYPHEKRSLPSKEGKQEYAPLEYYLVKNTDHQKALFGPDGKKRFGFLDCESIVLDERTKTVIVNKKTPEQPQTRSFLYSLEGKLRLDASFETIAYIPHTELMALIAQDGPTDEYYLYNPFQNTQLGPYDHFNIYNEDFTTPKGLPESNYAKYKQALNVIKVRKDIDNDYIWGILDAEGKELLPMEYLNLKLITEADLQHPAFRNATKPEGVDFIFRGAHQSDRSKSIYFDQDLTPYEFILVIGGTSRIEKQ